MLLKIFYTQVYENEILFIVTRVREQQRMDWAMGASTMTDVDGKKAKKYTPIGCFYRA